MPVLTLRRWDSPGRGPASWILSSRSAIATKRAGETVCMYTRRAMKSNKTHVGLCHDHDSNTLTKVTFASHSDRVAKAARSTRRGCNYLKLIDSRCATGTGIVHRYCSQQHKIALVKRSPFAPRLFHIFIIGGKGMWNIPGKLRSQGNSKMVILEKKKKDLLRTIVQMI